MDKNSLLFIDFVFPEEPKEWLTVWRRDRGLNWQFRGHSDWILQTEQTYGKPYTRNCSVIVTHGQQIALLEAGSYFSAGVQLQKDNISIS